MDDARAISSNPRYRVDVRTKPAHCLPLWLALPGDSIANQATHRDGQIGAAAQRHCTNAAAFARDVQHAIAQAMRATV
ncbi:hypothetical protein LN565_22755 [Xanthomonas euvesicatoria pv. euvesicatoria]|uniref:Uncharacterized protein n=5 Tax=Xanthomonas TaxID=338 RepID=Q3BZQ0_XANE5|nr:MULTISPECIES: hypothetical protein [Xanthomonas]AOY67759.1 hypothetical protein BHE83_15090 [Xanthomonas euvesicatoria pv. vesicatoria str. 85-10]APO92463.1 hypothetical protein BJD11_22790 [Xanthomonas euvesicatoria]MCC8505302.1 hypothetical protein [Xanthomonas euvesicatoria pv. euvesicatoria]MCC8518356.1 hypothetical protein [Xanthomonas euvesicatoria pv. euvesicatoria]MCC8543732.1 hypothetical protein [Xanthomonas euvesicatoria pv. euvesicatoria]